MADYKTPGVYVEEITTLPPSVGQVPTAIPAFVGYTSKATKAGRNLNNVPTHITSMLDYHSFFGGSCSLGSIKIKLSDTNNVDGIEFENQKFLYDSVRLFFANGGGECYIVSVGLHNDPVDVDALLSGVDAIKKEDHPTILVCPDAMLLEKKEAAYSVQQSMLLQCSSLQDRVAVLDVFDGHIDRSDEDVVLNFRNGIGVNSLKYGAAYYPWIQSTFDPTFSFEDVILINNSDETISFKDLMVDTTLIDNLESAISDLNIFNSFLENPLGNDKSLNDSFFDIGDIEKGSMDEANHYANVINSLLVKITNLKELGFNNDLILNELTVKTNANSFTKMHCEALYSIDLACNFGIVKKEDFTLFDLENTKPAFGGDEPKPQLVINALKSLFEKSAEVLLDLKNDFKKIKDGLDTSVYNNNDIYKNVVNEIQKKATLIPPSGAISGLYAMVDSERGVWKAPANVSLSSVVQPWIKLDNQQQEDLNVDVLAGKSVNAIRSFTGKGTLVWGARTLAGNDNEWRYISVRRLFNMVEKSVRLSTNWAVFEPNDQGTWIRVKAMIENYLTNLWSQGALAGSAPGAAFFVNIGLGSTMTQVDILEGRMNIEIGMAAVRPAEFIVLKFSHKLQES